MKDTSISKFRSTKKVVFRIPKDYKFDFDYTCPGINPFPYSFLECDLSDMLVYESKVDIMGKI